MIKEKIKIIISGAFGRMGSEIIKKVSKNSKIQLIAALENEKSKKKKIKENIKIISINDLKNKKKYNFDIIIDFSHPDYTMKLIEFCFKNNKNIVIGTTGFDKYQLKKIKLYSEKIAIVYSANFSIGINIIHNLIKNICNIIEKKTDIEIIETHHRKKIDAPSGTALQLGKKISNFMKWNFNKSAIFHRHGNIGIRENKKIGFSVIRSGKVIGEHTILFDNHDEQLFITHKAMNRSTFAKGALKSALWVYKKKNGLFNMSHVIKNQK